jgi:3-oxoacyl-[acyl-carrier-protein] synthase II
MAFSAAEEAMRAAGLDARSARVGLVVGGTTGGMLETEQILARLHAEPCRHAVLLDMLSHPLSATGDRLHERLGPFVRVRTLSSACSSGANALVVAAGWLQSGEVDAVVAGASDGLCRLTLSGFNALAAIDPEPCRPFDLRRQGISLGEGAGFLVLERAERARARRAEPIAAFAGWASGSEAHHITNPAPDGATVARLIRRALHKARLEPSDVDYVNAHGTGTPLNDSMEAAALATALGPELTRIPVSSSKGQIGHTLGAAGAIEAAITALVVARRTLVPTGGLEQPDPSIPLVHVPGVGVAVDRVRAALSNAFGFGGMDAVLLFAEPELCRDGTGVQVTIGGPLGPAESVRAVGVEALGPLLPVVTGVSVLGPCRLAGSRECADLAENGPAPDDEVTPDDYLDLPRARRLDRLARFGAVVVERALVEAGASEAGVVLGSAFGNVDGSAAFMHRVFGKGARFASPADFPNLVPSSPVGHVSIYVGLSGPAFAVCDLATSGESAFAQACQLVARGEANRMVCGAAELESRVAGYVLRALFAPSPQAASARHRDMAAAVVVESEQEAIARGVRSFARVSQLIEWQGGDGKRETRALRAPKTARAEVVLARDSGPVMEVLKITPWRDWPRIACAPALGESDALGAVAIAVASARVRLGTASEALILGVGRDRGYAMVLTSP